MAATNDDSVWLTKQLRIKHERLQESVLERFMEHVTRLYYEDNGWSHDEIRAAVGGAFDDDTGYELFDDHFNYVDEDEEEKDQ
jgi:hypothetical protein